MSMLNAASRRGSAPALVMIAAAATFTSCTSDEIQPDGGPSSAPCDPLDQTFWVIAYQQLDGHTPTGIALRFNDDSRILVDSPDADNPQLSPDGGRVAYELDISGSPKVQIWAINRDGTDAHPVAEDGDENVNAMWSPDGERIAYIEAGSDPPTYQVVVVDADGGNKIVVDSDAGPLSGDPVWSPDGNWIAWTTSAYRTNEIRWNEVDGPGKSSAAFGDVSDGGYWNIGSPVWLPGGDGFMVRASQGLDEAKVYSVSLAGVFEPIANAQNFGGLFRLPDGTIGAVEAAPDVTDVTALLSVDLETGEQEIVAELSGIDPSVAVRCG